MTPAPTIEQRWVCIAAADQTALAAQLSSYFNDPGVYFALFEFPPVEHPYEEVPATKDGYYAQIIGKRAATHINNCLAQMQPGTILLLGLSTVAETYLRAILPSHLLVTVETEAELLALPFATGKQVLTCKRAQAIEGLIAAKVADKALRFAYDATDLPTRSLRGKKGLVFLENPGGVTEVSIINYAMSVDADVVLADEVNRKELQSLPRDLQLWARDHSSTAFQATRKKITRRIKDIDFSIYDVATFFTTGLPYGLILKNAIPCTHILNGPYCDVFLANAIIEEDAIPVGSAVHFSLDDFADEASVIAQRLDEHQFVITPLIGKTATNGNLTNYGSYFPYDLLHICSHGGETDGHFVEQDFTDRDGNKHHVTYFEVVSFDVEAALDPDKIKVEAKVIFAKFNGIPWVESPISLQPRYVWNDMMNAIREDRMDVKRTPVIDPIALSCHVQCYRGFHQGAFEQLAAHAHPIILNNSCSSSHELAAGFLAAGARSYIATLWRVGDKTAKQAALAFYDAAIAHGKVLPAFSAMLESIKNPLYRDIYICWGLHFTTFPRPIAKDDDQIIAGLLATHSRFATKLATTKDDEAKRNILPIVRFLRAEIDRRLPPERLQQLLTSQMTDSQDEIERSQEFPTEPAIDEVVIIREIDRPKERDTAT